MAYVEIGSKIIGASDIVEVQEKVVSVKKERKISNPKPRPKNLLMQLFYFSMITEYEERKFTVIVLKVKRGVQVSVRVDSASGNQQTTGRHQLFDFYAICSDSDFLECVKKSCNRTEVELEIGNYYRFPEVLNYSEYLDTNVMIDADIKNKSDFMKKYMQ